MRSTIQILNLLLLVFVIPSYAMKARRFLKSGKVGKGSRSSKSQKSGVLGEGFNVPTTVPFDVPTDAPSYGPTDDPSDAPSYGPTAECMIQTGIDCVTSTGEECLDIVEEQEPVCSCPECARALSFKYTGKACSPELAASGECTDNGPNPFIAGFRITNAVDATQVLATGVLQQNDQIIIEAVSDGCIPDTLAVTISVPTGAVTQTFTIDASCDGGRELTLLSDYGSFQSYGYSCSATDTHNCLQEVNFDVEVCNVGSDSQTVHEFVLEVIIDGFVEESNLIEDIDPVMLQVGECSSKRETSEVNVCEESYYNVIFSASATDPDNCEDSTEIAFGWGSIPLPPETSQPSPSPSPAPSPEPSPYPSPAPTSAI